MKQNIIQFVAVLIVTIVVATGFTYKKQIDLSHYKVADDSELFFYVPNEDEIILSQEEEVSPYSLFLGKSYVGFKEALGFKESRGNYSTINTFGYLGKYQFARTTLQMIGVYNPDLFLADSELQEKAFSAYTSRNKWILRKDIKRYVGRNIGGVKITESGILAAAHLAGAGNVKKYLRSGGAIAFSDAFGTSIKHYLRKFSGYDTSHIIPNRKAKVLL